MPAPQPTTPSSPSTTLDVTFSLPTALESSRTPLTPTEINERVSQVILQFRRRGGMDLSELAIQSGFPESCRSREVLILLRDPSSNEQLGKNLTSILTITSRTLNFRHQANLAIAFVAEVCKGQNPDVKTELLAITAQRITFESSAVLSEIGWHSVLNAIRSFEAKNELSKLSLPERFRIMFDAVDFVTARGIPDQLLTVIGEAKVKTD